MTKWRKHIKELVNCMTLTTALNMKFMSLNIKIKVVDRNEEGDFYYDGPNFGTNMSENIDSCIVKDNIHI